MSVYAVTGSASGIGAATAALLTERGHRVIGVDRADADVIADLATDEGRRAAIHGILEQAGERLNGFVPCAGLAGLSDGDSALLVSVNYFGAVELAFGLRPALEEAARAGEPSAVVLVSSNSTTSMPGWAREVARACVDDGEERARALAVKRDAVTVYPATKAALAWWARTEGVRDEWAGVGIRVNAVAPGLIATAMSEGVLADPVFGRQAERYPTALDRPGRPEEVAALIAFLLSEEASLLVGSLVFADGGTDAIKNPRWPVGQYVPRAVMSLGTRTLARRAARAEARRSAD